MVFCEQGENDPLHSSAVKVLTYFTELFSTRGYSALNTARAALATIVTLNDGYTIGNHPLIVKFFKGAFNLKPSLPRYTEIWDVHIVFNYLRRLAPATKLGLQDLTLKTCMLVALLTAQRKQTLHLLNITDMTIKRSKFIFYVKEILKTSKPGSHGLQVELAAYPPDRRLCVYTYLVEYLKRTKVCRGKERYLSVSYIKPHSRVSVDTISRWLMTVMQRAGLNVSVFKPHSVRTSAVSAANLAKVPVSDILAHVGWKNEKTFQKYYNKPLLKSQEEFGASLLERQQEHV